MNEQGETTTTQPKAENSDTLGGIIQLVGWAVAALSAIFWVVMFSDMNDSGFDAAEYTDIQKWSMTISCLASLSLGFGLVGLGQIVKRR